MEEVVLINIILERIYPIGSIYTSFSDSRNPSIILGFGIWEKIKGRFIVGFDENQEEFNVANQTGGSKFLQKHHHHLRYGNKQGVGVTISVTGNGEEALDVTNWAWKKNVNNGEGSSSNLFTNEVGKGDAGNLPPYIVAYIWKRVY